MLKNRNKVLGINARSRFYLRGNSGRARDIADDKLRTKQLLMKHGIAAAELIAVVEKHAELQAFDWEALPKSFVIKPNRGLGGEGILVIYNRLENGNWLTTRRRQLTREDLVAHVMNILDGNYSLLHTPDKVLFEARLSMDPLYKRFASEGIPDIRVIIYNGVPVMAMIRVPTKKSGGKANLAQGGVGIGIDITTGFTTHAIVKSWFSEVEVERHPDTNVQLRGIRLPYWDEILKTALLASRVVGLKYAGVDISIDKKRGPVVLELNARPGLGIQVANMIPLRERLDRIKGLKVDSPERGIGIARELFSGHLEQEVASITGRHVVGLVEQVTLYGRDTARKLVLAKIDTGADDSSLDWELARALGFGPAIDAFQSQQIPAELSPEQAEALLPALKKAVVNDDTGIVRLSVVKSSHGVSIRPHVKLQMTLAGYKIPIEPNLFDRSHLKYPIIIGRRNLSRFLVDVAKLPATMAPTKKKAKKAEKTAAALAPEQAGTESEE
jgi:alpha-L-glutamate ligase-like protein